MTWTQDEALALVKRSFPNRKCFVADGDQTQESGLVTGPEGKTMSSFRLVFREPCQGDDTPEVVEIRMGQPGQFCGTVDELAEFDRHFPDFSVAD